MALKTPFFIYFNSLKSSSRFLKVNYNCFSANYLPVQLCHSHSVKHSSPLDSPEIQKYLQYIETDKSFIHKIGQSELDKFQEVLDLLERKKILVGELNNLEAMSSEGDKELEKLMKEEKQDYIKQLEDINNEIYEKILPGSDEDDNRGAEIQIIPAVGGDEAKLFAEELYTMYLNYIDFKGWCCDFAELRGQKLELRSAYIKISGDWVYDQIKYEGGVHRVQRVPETEKQGRTHTSTCSVVVLPQPKPFEIVIKDSDVEIEKMRSSAPGGQNVNKTESCIRIKHLPTGISVDSQTSRHQHENKTIAFEKLRSILFNIERKKAESERRALSKQQMGTSDYSDKIRTYNFNQNRVTDHRINFTMHNLKGFMTGNKELDAMLYNLKESNRKEQLKCHIAQVLESVEYKNFSKNKVSN